MAEPTWLRSARYGQGNSGHTDLDHHLHDNDPAYGAICIVFDQLDLHDELHHTVGIYNWDNDRFEVS